MPDKGIKAYVRAVEQGNKLFLCWASTYMQALGPSRLFPYHPELGDKK